jgi:hypothetical protein
MKGNVRLMHYSDLPSDIPTDEEVLALLDKLNGEKSVPETKPAAG